MKKKHKIVSILLRIFTSLLFVAALTLLIVSIVARKDPNASVFGYRFYRIADTGSMVPTLNTGEIAITRETDPAKLQVGDIISFVSSDPHIKGMINTHRITAIEEVNGESVFTTAGDAHLDENGNVIDDLYKVHPEDIKGKVVRSSKTVGKIYDVLSNRKLSFCITLLPLIIIVVVAVFELAITYYRRYPDDGEDKKD